MSDPHDHEFALLACAIEGGIDVACAVMEIVKPDCFQHEAARPAYTIVCDLANSGGPVDSIRFFSAWKSRNVLPIPPALMDAMRDCVSPSHFKFHADQVVASHKRTKLKTEFGRLLERLNKGHETDAVLADAEGVVAKEEISAPVLNPKELAHTLTDHLEQRFNLQGRLSGIATGFGEFDRMTDGLQLGEQTIMAARPSIGKTAIGLNIVHHACFENRVPTLIISLEMSPAAMMRRLLSFHSRISLGSLRSGILTDHEFTKIHGFNLALSTAPLHLLNFINGVDSARLCAAARRLIRREGIKLVVIDYLQKIRPVTKAEKRTYEVAEVSGALRTLAVSSNVALLTLAQLNRESEKDKPRLPRLSDLADSAQIERDADTVAMIDRKRDEGEGEATIIIGKQRDGEVGAVKLRFNGRYCAFSNP